VCSSDLITLRSFATRTVDLELSLELDSNFDDIFTVRGAKPGRRGTVRRRRLGGGRLKLDYAGADGCERSTDVSFSPKPDRRAGARAIYSIRLRPGARRVIRMRMRLHDEGRRGARGKPMRRQPAPPLEGVSVETDSALLNTCLQRSFADLRMLVMSERGHRFFSAGVPWYVALFGRDSLVTALETMAFGTDIAADTLRLLAAYQATSVDEARDAEPGKILHELRVGERANLQEPPPTPYYGTVDATPLFLIVLAEYVRWTGDMRLFHELRSTVDRALQWLDRYGDSDGDGLVDYKAGTRHGFRNQGWKDSDNSVVNADGSLAKPPIALIEVQGYAYRARLDVAWMLRATGDDDAASKLEAQAKDLKRRVASSFWSERLDYPAMAVQRDGRRAEVVASNPGQALWTGVLERHHAERVAKRLLDRSMFSGWGVRTLAADERAYNPIDYQVGAVWPHDTALIMAGLKRAGRAAAANRLLQAMIDAATCFPRYRLPELFAGHGRDEFSVPVRYPVACSPQAWAAGALPYMVIAGLGLEPDATRRTLTVRDPNLADGVGELTLRGIRVGDARADLRFARRGRSTEVEVIRLDGQLDVTVA